MFETPWDSNQKARTNYPGNSNYAASATIFRMFTSRAIQKQLHIENVARTILKKWEALGMTCREIMRIFYNPYVNKIIIL
jgi:hypothetical protein